MAKAALSTSDEKVLHDKLVELGVPEHAILARGGAGGFLSNFFGGLSGFVDSHPLIKTLIQTEVQKLIAGIGTAAVAGS